MSYKLIFLCIGFVISGCGTFNSGGAPDQSFDIEKDLQQLADEYSPATEISNFYAKDESERLNARNRFVSGRLVQIDLQYIKYVRGLMSGKQNLNTTTDALILGLGLAGTLVSGARSKTNLAAAAAGVVGTKSIIDKNYFYDQSIDALIGAMNARRKLVLVRILNGVATDTIGQYPMEVAIVDTREYFEAGTINGAVAFISSESEKSQASSDKKIQSAYRLSVPLESEIDEIGKLTDAIADADLSRAQAALTTLGVPSAKIPADLDTIGGVPGAKDMLKAKVREAKNQADPSTRATEITKVSAAFKAAGLIK